MAKWIFGTKNKGDLEIERTDGDTVIARTTRIATELIGGINFKNIESLGNRDESY